MRHGGRIFLGNLDVGEFKIGPTNELITFFQNDHNANFVFRLAGLSKRPLTFVPSEEYLEWLGPQPGDEDWYEERMKQKKEYEERMKQEGGGNINGTT